MTGIIRLIDKTVILQLLPTFFILFCPFMPDENFYRFII